MLQVTELDIGQCAIHGQPATPNYFSVYDQFSSGLLQAEISWILAKTAEQNQPNTELHLFPFFIPFFFFPFLSGIKSANQQTDHIFKITKEKKIHLSSIYSNILPAYIFNIWLFFPSIEYVIEKKYSSTQSIPCELFVYTKSTYSFIFDYLS